MILVIVLAVGTIAFDVYQKKKENAIIDNLTQLIINKKYKEFDDIIDSPEIKKHFAKFNHLFLKLNKEILVNNTDKAESIMKQLEEAKLSSRQKEAFYSKAFYYFVAKEDKENATKYHDLYMASCKNNRGEIDRVHDVAINKGYKYLDKTISQLENADDTKKIQLYSLISTMYENKGENEKSEEYLAKLKELIDKISAK